MNMRRILWCFPYVGALALLSVAGVCQLAWQDRNKPPASFGIDPYYDARRVRDLYFLSRSLTKSPTAADMLVCDVFPDHQSGIENGYLKLVPGTHRYVPTGETDPACDFGTYRVVGSFGPAQHWDRGSFKWRSPARFGGGFVYMFFTDPFADGGLAAFTRPVTARLETHPIPTYAIAPGYQSFLVDELVFNRAHPSWTVLAGAQADPSFVRQQLKSGNPLLVMEATRALVETGKLDAEGASRLVGYRADIRQSCEVTAILCALKREQEPTLGHVILQTADSAKSADDLKGLLIGAAVAYSVFWEREAHPGRASGGASAPMSPPTLTGEGAFARSVIMRVLERRTAIGAATPGGRYVDGLNPWPA